MRRRMVIAAACPALLGACASSTVVSLPVQQGSRRQIRRVAIAAQSGAVGDALGLELASRGIDVMDAATTEAALKEVGAGAPTTLGAMAALRAQGVDAVVAVTAVLGYDGSAQSATVRVSSTHTGSVVGGVSWQNGWGGMPGSMADRTVRRGLVATARELADALLPQLR